MSLLEHIRKKDLEGLRAALQGAPDLAEVDNYNRDLVTIAALYRQSEMVRLLLAAGVPLTEPVSNQFLFVPAALQVAVTEGLSELIPPLLGAGAVLNEKIVQKAAGCNNPDCLFGLLPHLSDELLGKVKVEQGNLLHAVLGKAGMLPFWIESTRRLVSALLARGISLEETDARGSTPLKLAKRFRLVELYDLLGGKVQPDPRLEDLRSTTGLSLERWPIFRSEPDVYVASVTSEEARESFDEWAERLEGQGYWPLLLPSDPVALGLIAENAEQGRKAAKGLDLDAWLAKRRAKLKVAQGDWSEPQPRTSSFLGQDSLVLALVPGAPEEIPGRLGPTGVNDFPPAAVHLALLRQWRERYGARVFGFDGKSLELRVARPPQDRESALELALESWAYCPTGHDGMTQQQQAAFLMQPLWFFWWD